MALIKAQILSDAGAEAGYTLEQLLQTLQHDEASYRRQAARDLVAYPTASQALLAQLAQEQDTSVREVIFTSLTRIGNEDAVAGLITCLRSEDAMLRNEAIEAMKQLPQEMAPIMSQLLHDPDSDVRIFAVNVLESLCHPEVENWLIEVISHDSHVNVCATAVDLLGEVGSPRAHDALQALKQRFVGEPYIQFAADIALKRITQA